MSTAAPVAAAGSTAGSLAARRRFRLLAVYRTTARVLLSYGALELLSAVRGAAWAAAAAPRWHRTNARRVVRTVLAVQGLFIKIGQLVSSLAGVLPASFRDELALLQDRIPPRPWEEIRDRLTAELGAPPEALFADVDRTAVAAASLAQVHAARLADGRRVAVKVQHLGIEQLARLDLATARRVLAIAGFFTGARGLDGVFDSVRTMIDEELDFRREADHTERIAASLRRDPLLDAPPVVRELSTARVLVTGFVDGIKVSDVDALDARGIDRAALAQRILSAYCRMIFDDGDFHADPHPGNLLVRDDGGVVFLDFGAVGRLSPAMRQAVPRLLAALLRRDRDATLDALRQMGFVERGAGDEVARRVIDYLEGRFLAGLDLDAWTLGDFHFDAGMKLEMMADLRRLDVLLGDLTAAFQVPREWILLLRTLVLLLGVCTRLDPAMRPMATLRPHLESLALGGEGDWLGLASRLARDLAVAAVTLPGDLRRLLARAERGELAVEARGLRDGFTLLYALGHQLLAGAFALAGGGLAYAAHARGDHAIAAALAWVAGASLALLAASLWRARRWQRNLRRGAR